MPSPEARTLSPTTATESAPSETALRVPAGATLFIDDVELNCTAARELGLGAVWFRSTEQAIAEIERAL